MPVLTIAIDARTYLGLQKIADGTGKTLTEAADEALNEWMEVNGEPILKALQRKKDATRKSCRQSNSGQVLLFRKSR
jgi:hypothetical protein